jgi:hypothetical protein
MDMYAAHMMDMHAEHMMDMPFDWGCPVHRGA